MFIIAYFIGIEDVNTLALISLMMCFAIASTAWATTTHCVILPILINAVIMLVFWIRFGLLFELVFRSDSQICFNFNCRVNSG